MKNKLATKLFAAFLAGSASAGAAEIKTLPEPDLNQPSPALMQLLNTRKSERSFDKNKKIDDQTLSEILWAAYGKNSYDRRTVPTAMNQKNLKVFVLGEDGVWIYNPDLNQLEKISDENVISYLAKQDYVLDAPIHLVYTSSDKRWGYDHAGSAYQNVYLYATAKGLATVVRGFADFDALHDALKLSEEEFAIIHQPIGYPK